MNDKGFLVTEDYYSEEETFEEVKVRKMQVIKK